MEDEIRKEIYGHLKDFQNVYLATSDGEQARLRPVTLV